MNIHKQREKMVIPLRLASKGDNPSNPPSVQVAHMHKNVGPSIEKDKEYQGNILVTKESLNEDENESHREVKTRLSKIWPINHVKQY